MALIEDVALITAKHQHYDKDDYTLTYRVLWLFESMTETTRARYQSEMKGLLGKLDQTDKKFTEKALRRLSSKNLFRISRSSGELLPGQSSKVLLRKTLTWGMSGAMAKSLGGAFEAYQIYKYDIPGTSGLTMMAHLGKLASSIILASAGILEAAFLFGGGVAPWLIPGFNLFAGVLYAICTAYLNFVKEDDVTSWLITTPWVTSKFVDSNPTPLDYESDGYLKALEAYSRLKNKPTLYYHRP
ncbi:hypothetical protein MHO82_24165 [Vibrio sp. Of7-15]|uniref:hypothetical protein n=1 Tax=Vibrio sp. Of7-15 TaxID=2724879 RepID=UPI001EF27FA3|nr:hypothetical protein [Vibrio sp. Of7-15]MCG7499966.1 hypothetical protein [Vibrio sp. Of7-15]